MTHQITETSAYEVNVNVLTSTTTIREYCKFLHDIYPDYMLAISNDVHPKICASHVYTTRHQSQSDGITVTCKC